MLPGVYRPPACRRQRHRPSRPRARCLPPLLLGILRRCCRRRARCRRRGLLLLRLLCLLGPVLLLREQLPGIRLLNYHPPRLSIPAQRGDWE